MSAGKCEHAAEIRPLSRETTAIAFAALLAGLTQLYLESNKSPAASAYVQLAVLAVVLFTNIVMRLRFPYAVATSVVMLARRLTCFFGWTRC